jgi:hypothetical protein
VSALHFLRSCLAFESGRFGFPAVSLAAFLFRDFEGTGLIFLAARARLTGDLPGFEDVFLALADLGTGAAGAGWAAGVSISMPKTWASSLSAMAGLVWPSCSLLDGLRGGGFADQFRGIDAAQEK